MASLFCKKLYNYFFVYLPTILIIILTLIVYNSYVWDYLLVLIRAKNNINPDNEDEFVFHLTSSLKHAYTKGLVLLIITLTLFILLLLSLLRAAFCDPGYFPDPLELEYKILTARKKVSKHSNNFISKFSDLSLNGPLTLTEQHKIEGKLREEYTEKMKEDPLNLNYTNEEIIEMNKKNYTNNKNIPSTSCFHSNEDVYLDIYKGVDLAKMNYCPSCLRLKVERSHHCRKCQKCVLKMDHHCPWLANCIGFYNLKYFLLLQFYGIILCLIYALSFWEAIIGYNVSYETNMMKCWYIISCYLLNIGLFAFLIWLAMINWKNLFYGQTVIEHSERVRFPSTKLKNIYDMGFKRNFINVFGRNPLVWFIPFFPNMNGRGYVFETNTNQFFIK